MTEYDYTKTPCAIDRLTQEIQQSAIVTSLAHMNLFGTALTIFFNADLSDTDKAILDSLVAAHNGTPLTQNQAQPVIVQNDTTVTTQFEKRDKTLKLASTYGTVQSDGTAVAYLKVPGTPNPTGDITLEGRWIGGGVAFFDVQTPGDMITGVRFVDHDNVLGQGVDFVVGSYTDDDSASANQGWYIPPARGQVDAEPIGGYGFAPAGFYVMITSKKGGGITTGTLYVNLEWGKVEA